MSDVTSINSAAQSVSGHSSPMDVKRQLMRLFGLTDVESVEQVGDEMTGETGFLSFRQKFVVQVSSDKRLRVFVKMSNADREDLGPLAQLSVWSCARECEFYGLLAPILRRTARQFGLECTLPEVHLELSSSTSSLLVMDDLVSQGFELAPGVMTREQIRCVLSGLANVQTVFWLTQHKLGGAGLVKAFAHLTHRMDDPAKGSPLCFDDMLPRAHEEFSSRFAEFLPDPARRQIVANFLEDPEFFSKAKQLLASLNDETEAIGLVHFDLWFNNCMLRGQHDECRIIDWQFYSIGGFGFDVGLLLLSSADNAFVVNELDNFVDFFHSEVKTAFEEKSGSEFPVTLEKTRELARKSMEFSTVWFVLSADSLWGLPSVTNMLRNLADCVENFAPAADV